MPQADLNNYSFYYSEAGSGEPVVWVHGSASDYRTWKKQQKDFSKNYRSIIYSRRYHWPNKQIDEQQDYSMHEHVEDLEAFIKYISKEPVHLIGHSYGGFICLLLALKNPGLIRSLSLAEPPVIGLYVSNRPKLLELIALLFTRPALAVRIMQFGITGVSPAAKALKRDDPERALDHFGRAILKRKGYKNLSPERKYQARQNLIKAELLGSGFPRLQEEDVKKINIPTLLLSAEKSTRMFYHLSNALKELVPDAVKSEIPEAYHIMHEDNPAYYNAVLRSFLKTASSNAKV